jgi:hypothetical protein
MKIKANVKTKAIAKTTPMRTQSEFQNQAIANTKPRRKQCKREKRAKSKQIKSENQSKGCNQANAKTKGGRTPKQMRKQGKGGGKANAKMKQGVQALRVRTTKLFVTNERGCTHGAFSARPPSALTAWTACTASLAPASPPHMHCAHVWHARLRARALVSRSCLDAWQYRRCTPAKTPGT